MEIKKIINRIVGKKEIKSGKYGDKWAKINYPRKIELLNRINNNSQKLYPLPLKTITRDLAELSSIRNWNNQFMEKGYVEKLSRTKQQIDYKLTDKGRKYLQENITNENYLKAKEQDSWNTYRF